MRYVTRTSLRVSYIIQGPVPAFQRYFANWLMTVG
jgi:hypothetical protein